MPQEPRNLSDLISGLMQTTRQELIAGRERKALGAQQQQEYGRQQQQDSASSEKAAFDRAMKEAEFELERDYKQSQMNKKAEEKPLTLDQLIGKTAQGQMEAGQLDLNGLIELKRKIANKTGQSSDLLNRQTLSKAQNAFLEGRTRVPQEYETEDPITGEMISKVRFNESPFTGGTLDTLTSIGRGQFPQANAPVPLGGRGAPSSGIGNLRQLDRQADPIRSQFPTEQEYQEYLRMKAQGLIK